MSSFGVFVKRIRAIEVHPNANALEFAVIDGYRAIVRKGVYCEGDLVGYIPEQALVPQSLLAFLGLWDDVNGKGALSGPEGNRVKAIKLRGELSQGIVFDPKELPTHILADAIVEGNDLASALGITKYEPPIPVHMAGQVFQVDTKYTVSFDVENIKSYPDELKEGDYVHIAEKLHGTFTGIAILPWSVSFPEAFGEHKNILIFSKGLGAKGLVFKNNEANKDNLYVRAAEPIIREFELFDMKKPTFILGETVGKGVQDLDYGATKPKFYYFLSIAGYTGEEQSCWIAQHTKFNCAPVLYKGPYRPGMEKDYMSGQSTLAGHIREGVVITRIPKGATMFDNWNRSEVLQLKSVSPEYLTRKGGTEYN